MRLLYSFIFLILINCSQLFSIDGLLVQTIDYSINERWNNTIASTGPKITTVDTVFKKQYFLISAIAWDYAINDSDNADVDFSIKIIKPNGLTYFQQSNIPLIKTKIIDKNNLQMSNSVLKICFEDNDEIGNYNIEIELVDNLSKKTKQIKSIISLANLSDINEKNQINDDDYMKWFMQYYLDPTPEKVVPYYIYFINSSYSENKNAFIPTIIFFSEILKNNKFLAKQMIDYMQKQDLKKKIFILYVLINAEIDSADYRKYLNDNEKTKSNELLKNFPIDIYSIVDQPNQLDMLWAAFLSTGSYQPILHLIKTLEYSIYKGDLENFKTSKKTEEDRQKAINNAIFDALTWSLKSNCQQHELIKNYCQWAYMNETLTEIQKSELKKILEDL